MKVKQMLDERPVRMQYNIVDRPGYLRGQGELLDQTPLALPFDCKKPETLEQAIDRIMKVRSSRDLDDEWETEEESEDFDTDSEDDEIFDTPYTLFDEIPEGGSAPEAPRASSPESEPEAPQAPAKKRKTKSVEPAVESEDSDE